MRLIGRPELLTLTRGAACGLRDAVHALAAELEAATWQSVEDCHAAFPAAQFLRGRLIVDLDGCHCAAIAISYGKGVAVVEFAGTASDLDSAIAVRPGKKT